MSVILAYQKFIRDRKPDLRRIAGRTSGEYALEDVQQECWGVAAEIEQRRGFPLDFADADDQGTLLGWLYNKLVSFANKSLRYAVKLDRDWDKEELSSAAAALARFLTAPLNSDPAVRLQQQQDEHDLVALVQRSYSQASAYVLLLVRFEWDAEELASSLSIVGDTLRRRIKVCGIQVQAQPSLFDGVSIIDPKFLPAPARPFRKDPPIELLPARQRGWRF